MFSLNVRRGLLMLLALQAGIAAALPDDQQQPVHITADSAVQENSVVTYRGKVLIVQGSIRIDADEVVIYHDKGKLQRAVATGKPAHFQEQPEVDGGVITGSANKLIYHNADQRVELLQDAFVDRDKSTVKGNRIEYLLPSKTVRAEGSANNPTGRVEMVLQPNQAKPAAPPQPAPPPVKPAAQPAAQPSAQPPGTP